MGFCTVIVAMTAVGKLGKGYKTSRPSRFAKNFLTFSEVSNSFSPISGFW